MSRLTHVDGGGSARMVDVSAKPVTPRTAVAEGQVVCASETVRLVLEDHAPKGAVIATAELAGVMAAKRTADLIPLCHPLPLTRAVVVIQPDERLPGFRVRAETKTTAQTGVEMEALTAVAVACLTLYDMLKAGDRSMRIEAIRLVSKAGGASGDWASPEPRG